MDTELVFIIKTLKMPIVIAGILHFPMNNYAKSIVVNKSIQKRILLTLFLIK